MPKKDNYIKRPWGGYSIIKKTSLFWIKKIYVNQEARLSLQSHKLRTEIWVILEGSIIAQIGTKKQKGKAGDFFLVLPNQKHRITATENAVILEIAFGLVREGDIVRYEDDYDRISA